MGKFNNFIDNITPEVHNQTKTYLGTNLAIFEPERYIVNQEMCFADYHFILFYSTPPPAILDKKHRQFKKGRLISLEPGASLNVLPPANHEFPARYLDIAINKEFFHQIAFDLNKNNEIKFKRIEAAFSRHLIEVIMNFKNEIISFGNSYPLMIESISTQVVIQLLRDINEANTIFQEKHLRDQHNINIAIDYMQNYYSAPISIEDICQIANLSPHYFIRLFKQHTGQTPYQYLMTIRIQRAKEMLKKGKCSILEVSTLCGFVNSGHFSTLFKRYVGVSPTEYKKQSHGFLVIE